ncbi:MAG: carbohydrate-binding domain-containing protein, partial [Bacteroidales bacterium]|nr:carbohydrate-binding domain-containing protein [Bacteroidales bacterium]
SFTGSLVVTYAASDGINVNQYFEQNGGTVKISGIMGDGLQVNADVKYTGYVNINGGTIDISAAGAGCKGIKAAGYIRIDDDKSAPVITIANSGTGTYDDTNRKAVGAACMTSDADITIDAGTITLNATGNGGKGLKCDSTFTMNGGTLSISTSGTGFTSNGDSTYPKGLKAGTDSGTLAGGIVINGGNVSVNVSGKASGCEGMESDNIITIKGGVTTVNAYDDAINSGSDMTVEGGCVYARSTNNDGIDTNGNCYIKGGLVYAISGNAPEVAIDANSEEQKKLYVTGGTIVALGGLESGANLSQTCYAASSWNKNTWYALTYGSETFAFQTPSSGGTTMVVSAPSTPSLQSGVSVSGGTEIFDGVAYTGASVSGGSAVSLSSYSGGNGGGTPGGGGGPGGGRGW